MAKAKMTPAQIKAQQTRYANENKRNLKIERMVDDDAPADFISVSEFNKSIGRATLFADWLDQYASCYWRWTGQKIKHSPALTDHEYDFGSKIYPRNVLHAIYKYKMDDLE